MKTMNPRSKERCTVLRPLAPPHRAERLHERLGFAEAFTPPAISRDRGLHEWRMEENDSPILRYLFRCARPRRHLEFGTWEGRGALDCLEECDATVWSINLRDGETDAQGRWAYDAWLDDFASSPSPGSAGEGRGGGDSPPSPDRAPLRKASTSRLTGNALCSSTPLITRTSRNGRTVVRTDALGAIGRLVHERGLGHRLCQVYCDSRQWDCSTYPDGFFDTALIDGGHAADVVASDTLNALRLVRAGGLILWHDYCPDAVAQQQCPSIRGVMVTVCELAPTIRRCCTDWFWIEPSWLLVGVRNEIALERGEVER